MLSILDDGKKADFIFELFDMEHSGWLMAAWNTDLLQEKLNSKFESKVLKNPLDDTVLARTVK